MSSIGGLGNAFFKFDKFNKASPLLSKLWGDPHVDKFVQDPIRSLQSGAYEKPSGLKGMGGAAAHPALPFDDGSLAGHMAQGAAQQFGGATGQSRQALGQLQNTMHQMRLGAGQMGGDFFSATAAGLGPLQQTSRRLSDYNGSDLAQQVAQLQQQLQQLQQKLQMLSGGGPLGALARFL